MMGVTTVEVAAPVQILGDYPGDVPRGGDIRGITSLGA